MTDADLWATWRIWMAVAVVVILIVAVLLIAIWLTARGILAHAVRALAAADRIRLQTAPIWALQATNTVADELLETVEHIETVGGQLAGALESTAGASGGPTHG